MDVIEIISDSKLKILCELTVELTRLRQNECSHLCVENVAPEILQKLVEAYCAGVSPPQVVIDPDLMR